MNSDLRTEILYQINKKINPFEECIVRIRKNDNDRIYYKGNEAFKISKDGQIQIENNIYKCNTKEIYTYLKRNNKAIIENSKERIELCETIANKKVKKLSKINKYIDFNMNKIEYKYVNETKFSKEEFNKGLKKFKGDIKEMFPKIDIKESNDLQIEFDNITNYIDILKIQCLFILDLKLDENYNPSKRTIISPKFKEFKLNVSIKDINEFKKLFKIIKKSIKDYSGKKEIEKKYQHQFMLKECESKGIFCDEKYTNVEGIEYFEQEYGIINKDRKITQIDKNNHEKIKDKTGRVDCVFYRVKENILTDIYLIELKVDRKVILGSNGVMTHLDDIKYFVNDEKQKNKLCENIKYRYDSIYKKQENILEVNKNNIKYHFYTIIGFTNDEDRNYAKRYLEYLKTEGEIYNLCNRSKEREDKNVFLDQYFEGKTIYDLVNPIKNKCAIKFFFEKSNWNKENISIEFEDVTKELYNNFKD